MRTIPLGSSPIPPHVAINGSQPAGSKGTAKFCSMCCLNCNAWSRTGDVSRTPRKTEPIGVVPCDWLRFRRSTRRLTTAGGRFKAQAEAGRVPMSRRSRKCRKSISGRSSRTTAGRRAWRAVRNACIDVASSTSAIMACRRRRRRDVPAMALFYAPARRPKREIHRASRDIFAAIQALRGAHDRGPDYRPTRLSTSAARTSPTTRRNARTACSTVPISGPRSRQRCARPSRPITRPCLRSRTRCSAPSRSPSLCPRPILATSSTAPPARSGSCTTRPSPRARRGSASARTPTTRRSPSWRRTPIPVFRS